MEYVFFRAEGFYIIDLKDDNDAIVNAEINDGTLKVETPDRRLVWKKERHEA